MTAIDLAGMVLVLAGLVFFIAGSAGLLRFPDVFSRLHALTKADILGLGLICLGLLVSADGIAAGLELLIIWLLALVASVTGAQLIAVRALNEGRQDGGSDDSLGR